MDYLPKQGSSKAQELPLTGGERLTALSDLCVQPFWQALDILFQVSLRKR